MSKYALKLEQLIQTDRYGDILVTIQYDGEGPKLVTANGEKIQAELKHMLDTVLGLVNFNLAKKLTPAEISSQLEVEPQDGIHTPLNDLLMVVARTLKEAPKTINEIDPNSLMTIGAELIKTFTQQAGGAASMPTEGQKPAANSAATPKEQPANNNQAAPEAPSKENKTDDGKGFFGGFSRDRR